MTERGLPLADGAPACPFVAFEDDRDERASVPDHRHRCYADARPSPRALAHQEAYCLSSAFPVCPTFQDWARREAARARGGAPTAPSASAGMNRAATGAVDAASVDAGSGAGAAGAPTAGAASAGSVASGIAGAGAGALTGAAALTGAGAHESDNADSDRDLGDASADRWSDSDADEDGRPASLDDGRPDDLVRRNPPRDWAAPPPWLASDERHRPDDADPPPFLGRRASEPGQGLVGSPADRLAGGPPPPPHEESDGVWSSDSRSAAAVGAGIAAGSGSSVAGRGRRSASPLEEDQDEDHGSDRPPARRSRAYAQHLGGPDGPDWERPRRYEAYPTIKARVGMPAVPRIVGLTGLVLVLALALFFLGPVILNLGGGTGSPGASPGSSSGPVASQSLAPTVKPAATPIIYTIKHGDTLLKIAKAHGITIEQLMAANPSIKDPNKISEGQQITIPSPSATSDTIGDSSAP